MIRCFSFVTNLFLIGCVTLLAFSQVPSPYAEGQDTTYIRSLIRISEKYWYNFPDSSIILVEEAMSRIDTLEDKQSLSLAYTSFGTAYYMKGDYDKGLDYYFKALGIDVQRGDSSAVGVDLSNIGNIFLVRMNYEKAHEYFSGSLKIKYSLNDKKGIGKTLLNIANLYISEGKYEIALSKLKESQLVFDSILDKNEMVVIYTTFGTIYNSDGKPEEALKYYNKALRISKDIGDRQNEVIININIGNIYAYFEKANKAIPFFEEALFIAQDIGYLEGLCVAFEKLYFCHESLGKTEDAFQYYKLYIFMRDSLQRKENNEAAVRNELEYNFEKERILAKTEQEKKEVVAKEKEKQQSIIIVGIFVLLCGALVIAYMMYRSYRVKKKANLKLEEINKVIAEKNKNITDSIEYASYIQQAILPDEQEFRELFPDSFVFFNPRDIVSGDFYLTAKAGDSRFLLTGDCTGHGVPGAFMSMMCVTLFNEIVNEKKILRPDLIFNELRKGITSAMKQKGMSGERQDGMDAVLCRFIDLGNRKIQFECVCANNPILIIRYSSNPNTPREIQNFALEEIPSDRFPVGIYYNKNLPFTLRTIELNKSDIVYSFSDGYLDQFGGEKQKKFMFKRFKELLCTIHDKPMQEQGKILKDTISKWKGELEQVDDICVIGVRI